MAANPSDHRALADFLRLAGAAAGAVWLGDAMGELVDEMGGAA